MTAPAQERWEQGDGDKWPAPTVTTAMLTPGACGLLSPHLWAGHIWGGGLEGQLQELRH